MKSDKNRVNVLGVGVNATSLAGAVSRLMDVCRSGGAGYVCVTGAHGVMESQRDEFLLNAHNHSLMTMPDGMPTVWMGHEYGYVKMGRVYGPDLMVELMRATAEPQPDGKRFTHFLYGSTEETLQKLKSTIEKRFPGVQIVGMYAPPFRPLTEEEEGDLQKKVDQCNPDFFWVGLSTPKQELFMATHSPFSGSNSSKLSDMSHIGFCKYPLKARIFLGVGAAFDIHSGNMKDSPEWMKNAGLQWLHRLYKEPRRLWRRYLWIVPGFLWFAFLQVMGLRQFDKGEDA